MSLYYLKTEKDIFSFEARSLFAAKIKANTYINAEKINFKKGQKAILFDQEKFFVGIKMFHLEKKAEIGLVKWLRFTNEKLKEINKDMHYFNLTDKRTSSYEYFAKKAL